MMEKLGNKYDDQSSGSSSDSEGSGDLKGDHSKSQNAADGTHPELEFLLGHSEPQGRAESLHIESRQTKTQHNESQQALSRSGNKHAETRHAESRHPMFSYSGTLAYYSYPVIDMRKAHRIGTPQFHKMKVKSTQKYDLKFEVGRMFNVTNNMIHIIEEKGQKEEVLLKTIIVILPHNTGEECCHLMIEWFESMDQMHPQILCARLPVLWKMTEVKRLLAEELGWKGLVLCQNGTVLEDSMDLNSCDFRKLEKIQAVKQSYHKTEFIYQPRTDISSTYCLDVDMNWSVKQVKKQFEMRFHDEIQKQKSCEESSIQFCFQDRLLDDKECIGLVLRKNIKEDKVSVHFGSENSISIDLKYRMGRKTKHKLLIVPKQISTACLRAEVSKHLGVDPKAVKLTIENKLLDEHDDLSQVHKGKWCSGCGIAAGIKKCKTLRIKHPMENEEVPFEMYMLESVSVLKRKIAERWELNFLQISLSCRGIQMENQQPLQYYPIKNNMEISLSLFEHRIILKVVVLKGKRKISLVIDNSYSTTVDDVLRFCAHHFSYARECSRGIFKERCLDRKCTLAEEGISSGDTMIISYFDQPHLLQGSLINIFMVHEDGHMVKRLGAVSSGLLLHAPKTAEAPQTEDTCLDNGNMPQGISICDAKEVCAFGMACHMLKTNEKGEDKGDKKLLSVRDSLKTKTKFLNQAKRIIQQKYHPAMEQLKLQNVELQERPSFYLEESDSENMTRDLISQELQLDEETGKKTVVSSNNGVEKSDASNIEVKTKVDGSQERREDAYDLTSGTECVRGEIESDCPANKENGPANEENEICQRVKCIESCCKIIREVQSAKDVTEVDDNIVQATTQQHFTIQESGLKEDSVQPCHKYVKEMRDDKQVSLTNTEKKSQNVDVSPENGLDLINYNADKTEPFSKQTKKTSLHLINDLSGCDTETSGCESSHDRTYIPNITYEKKEQEAETESSDIDHVTSRHGEDCQCTKCGSGEQFPVCPFLRFSMHSSGRRRRRGHTVSESAVALVDLSQLYQSRIPFNQTYPAALGVRFTEPNADIETAGISVQLLGYVATHLGKKWKQLLRKLSIDETTLTSIEYQHSSSGLHELCLQALLSWKREKGNLGTKEVLLKAVEEIGLKSVSEYCHNIGYFTA